MPSPSTSSNQGLRSAQSNTAVTYFVSPSEFREWLSRNHGKASALWVGFHKKKSGKLGLTYPKALDDALCFGWIDGIRKRLDQDSYTIRFSPRKPRSIWSAVNIKRVGELTRLGQMELAGLNAFAQRLPENQNRYSYEKGERKFDENYVTRFQANKKAWPFFQAQPPGYQRTATWWVMSARKEETRLKRLAILIADSEQGRRISTITGKPRHSGD
jgi:uncharacterized protein YdeI (YjbR/CyaY-like superfamily)